MARKEFWRYSSRNRPGHQPSPATAIRREFVLIHWQAGWIEEAIAERLGIDIDTVGRHLKEARKAGDPRAAIRHCGTLLRHRDLPGSDLRRSVEQPEATAS